MTQFHTEPLDRLRALRVRDVMNSRVVTVPSSATMCDAAETLTAAGASGAPVVDEAGRCTGVISALDFLKREAEVCRVRLSTSGVTCGASASDEEASVRDYMSTAVQTISSDETLVAAARIMCAQHIHRLIVLDERSAPTGVLTTLDVTSALVTAIDEQRLAMSRKENLI